MSEERPLTLAMTFQPERQPAPIDVADVLQSYDDAERLADRVLRYDLSVEAVLETPPWTLGGSPSPLRVRRISLGSPLEVLTVIPWSVVTYGGLWLFLAQIERFWNIPKRIRVESKRLDVEKAEHERDELAAKIDSLHLAERYWQDRLGKSGRYLQGPIEPPGFRAVEGRMTDAGETDGLQEDYGDRVHVTGILLFDGATKRLDGRGSQRVLYLICASAAPVAVRLDIGPNGIRSRE